MSPSVPQCPQYTPAVVSLSPEPRHKYTERPDTGRDSDCVREAGYKYFSTISHWEILIEIVSAWDQAQSAQVKMREGSLAQQFRLIKELILVTKGALTGTKSVH